MKTARFTLRSSVAAAFAATALSGLFQSAGAASREALARAEQFFRQGNAAYERSDYAAATDLYQKALDEGVADSRLYFNQANSLFRLGRLGPAILYYEKAHKLAPNDEAVSANLRFANARTVDKNPAPEPNALTKFLWLMHSALSVNQGLWLALGLFSVFFLAAAAAVFSGPALRGGLYLLMGLSALAFTALTPSLAYKIRRQESVQYGIVLKPVLQMYSGPGENYQVLSKVHEGAKFEIVERHGEWVSVKLLDGKGGYVRYADLGRV